MAKCPYCGREMMSADGCTYKHVRIGKKVYERFKVTEETPGIGDRCGDCGARVGHYHHPGCDLEKSPLTGDQLWWESRDFLI